MSYMIYSIWYSYNFGFYRNDTAMEEEKKVFSEQKRPCVNCGAELTYKPGTTKIKCDYCQHEEAIIPNQKGFKELELKPELSIEDVVTLAIQLDMQLIEAMQAVASSSLTLEGETAIENLTSKEEEMLYQVVMASHEFDYL